MVFADAGGGGAFAGDVDFAIAAAGDDAVPVVGPDGGAGHGDSNVESVDVPAVGKRAGSSVEGVPAIGVAADTDQSGLSADWAECIFLLASGEGSDRVAAGSEAAVHCVCDVELGIGSAVVFVAGRVDHIVAVGAAFGGRVYRAMLWGVCDSGDADLAGECGDLD